MKKRNTKNINYKKKYYKPHIEQSTAKSGTILCDENIQANKNLIKIECYLNTDNIFAKQLYNDPELKSLEVEGLKMSTEEFIMMLHRIDIKLLYIRSLEFTPFWSSTLDKNLREFMDTFLLNFDPYILRQLSWDKENKTIENMNNSYRSILKSFLMIYLRISKRSESSCDCTYEISPECYSHLVYDEFLIDTAKLLDLCAIYGKSNSEIVRQIVFGIFENEQRYYDDLLESITMISKQFNKLINEVHVTIENPNDTNDLTRKRLIERLCDVINNIENISKYFPPEGVDELFKVKAYLWLPVIRELTKSMALQLNKKEQDSIRLINNIMGNTIQIGIELANAGIILRSKSFKSDF